MEYREYEDPEFILKEGIKDTRLGRMISFPPMKTEVSVVDRLTAIEDKLDRILGLLDKDSPIEIVRDKRLVDIIEATASVMIDEKIRIEWDADVW